MLLFHVQCEMCITCKKDTDRFRFNIPASVEFSLSHFILSFYYSFSSSFCPCLRFALFFSFRSCLLFYFSHLSSWIIKLNVILLPNFSLRFLWCYKHEQKIVNATRVSSSAPAHKSANISFEPRADQHLCTLKK